MFFYGSDDVNELERGLRVVCTSVSIDSAHNWTPGNSYVVMAVDAPAFKLSTNDGDSMWVEPGDVFNLPENIPIGKQPRFSSGDSIVCLDATGSSFLKKGQEYVASHVTAKSVKVIGDNTAWKLSRFAKKEFKLGQKVKVVKKSAFPEKWHPQVGEEFVIKSMNARNNKVGVELPASRGTPEEFARGDKAIWPITMFQIVIELPKDEPVVVKEKKKIKLDAKKLHTHTCVNCAKQIFPKTMCKCPVNIEIPI